MCKKCRRSHLHKEQVGDHFGGLVYSIGPSKSTVAIICNVVQLLMQCIFAILLTFVLDVVQHSADMDVSDANKWSLGDVSEWLI